MGFMPVHAVGIKLRVSKKRISLFWREPGEFQLVLNFIKQLNSHFIMLTPEIVFEKLNKIYPKAKIALKYSNPLNLLIAVMLSAQCTDERVNIVTESLFKKYKTAKDYADADLDELKQEIRSTGFYNAKAKNIQNACKIIIEKHNGKVPHTMQELVALPGVARKTANIVLSTAFGKIEGIAIDTHMKRLNTRMGFTKQKQPDKIECDLMKQLPKDKWYHYTYLIIEHGRSVCRAPVPLCSQCVFDSDCPKINVIKHK